MATGKTGDRVSPAALLIRESGRGEGNGNEIQWIWLGIARGIASQNRCELDASEIVRSIPVDMQPHRHKYYFIRRLCTFFIRVRFDWIYPAFALIFGITTFVAAICLIAATILDPDSPGSPDSLDWIAKIVVENKFAIIVSLFFVHLLAVGKVLGDQYRHHSNVRDRSARCHDDKLN